MGLGENVAALRKRLGLTLDDLEERSNVGRAVIHAIERRRSRASKHAAALAAALGVTLDELMADWDPTAADIPDVTVTDWKPGDNSMRPVGEMIVTLGRQLEQVDDITREQLRPLLNRLLDDPSRAQELGKRAEALLGNLPDQAQLKSATPSKVGASDPVDKLERGPGERPSQKPKPGQKKSGR